MRKTDAYIYAYRIFSFVLIRFVAQLQHIPGDPSAKGGPTESGRQGGCLESTGQQSHGMKTVQDISSAKFRTNKDRILNAIDFFL